MSGSEEKSDVRKKMKDLFKRLEDVLDDDKSMGSFEKVEKKCPCKCRPPKKNSEEEMGSVETELDQIEENVALLRRALEDMEGKAGEEKEMSEGKEGMEGK